MALTPDPEQKAFPEPAAGPRQTGSEQTGREQTAEPEQTAGLEPRAGEYRPGRRRGNQWLRNVQANRIKTRRKGLSLRTQLIALFVILVLMATASLGSIAYRISRSIIEGATVREVGIAANARRQALLGLLGQQRVRAIAVLKTVDVGCEPDETWCLRKILVDFVATEGASAARMVYQGSTPVNVGKGAAALATAPAIGNQIARFGFDRDGQPYYMIQVRSDDAKAVLTIRGNTKVANQIFLDRYGLGQSGETFLLDEHGAFLTPPKYPSQGGETAPLQGSAVKMCLAGMDGETLDQGYRGVPVIRGYRHVPEIGGGCILALIDQAEAFAPTRNLARQVAGVSSVLAAFAIACSLMLAQLFSRPLKRLTGRARLLQKGDFESPVPVEGPAEVRMFAQTFEAMAISLRDSRAALQESTEQIRNILGSISDGFCAFDREWRCTYVNEKATELSRTPREELLGKNVWTLYPGSAGTPVYTELHRAMEERVPVHFEAHHPRFDLWFELDAYPTKDGLAVFGRDVTERKRFNERLQQTQKLESLGVLAGGIAHDFNNLLTGIIGNASIAMDEVPAEGSVRKSLQAVVNAGERAALLTRQLLAYAGKGRFVIEHLDLSVQVREIGHLLAASIPRTVQLKFDLDGHLPSIEGDVAQIQQLTMNLVINAAEAIEENKTETVLITTRLEEVEQAYIDQTVLPAGIAPGRYVTLEVRDAGCGMDEATRSRIFDPFFTTKFTGRGLGLAAAMGIVRGHKGALKVESAPGKGSSFKVLFPPADGEAVAPAPAKRQKSLTGRGTILVIDDEDAVRQTAKSALESYGYSVVVAENGKAGVEAFRKLSGSVFAVLLDMTMPVMSGEEALVHLQSIRQDIRVLLSSGYNESEATRRFNGKGLAGFVQKPYTAAQLAEKIQKVLERPADG
jgi:PAS domain S-box-containing protein